MLKLSEHRRFILFIIGLFISIVSYSQECKISIEGQIKDPHDDIGLEFGLIQLEETGTVVQSDSSGFFRFSNICVGEYHLMVSHPGCNRERLFLRVSKDSFVTINLEHHSHLLQTVTVQGSKNFFQSNTSNSINIQQLTRLAAKPFAEILEEFSGVSVQKNGSQISKPIIHGLSGNRIGIMQQGISIASQQWGNDHAPEIDPFGSQIITVIKGTDIVTYGGNQLGGMILLEQANIADDPHLHGSVLSSFQQNGNIFSLHTRLEKANQKFRWRTSVSSKAGGDNRSPDYYLTNTGIREFSGNLYTINEYHKNIIIKNFFGVFYTDLGVLRGSHIGNLTDLKNAIGRSVPLFTQEKFSFDINNPKQNVIHLFNKFSVQRNKGIFQEELNLSGQINRRREFDVVRARLSGSPALDLLLQSYFSEFKRIYQKNKFESRIGFQAKTNINLNLPGTTSYPLIPDYLLINPALFYQLSKSYHKFLIEAGTRVEANFLSVKVPGRNLGLPTEKFNHTFPMANLIVGSTFEPMSNLKLKVQTGFASRAPEANEMYSGGLHQSVAGIEEGNRALKQERSIKSIITGSYLTSNHVTFEMSIYHQNIQNYIYLEPTKELRLTVRGAFPVFRYNQENVNIFGLDFSSQIELGHHFKWTNRYSYVEIRNTQNQNLLVGTPPGQAFSQIQYIISFPKHKSQIQCGVNVRHVFERKGIEPDVDFLAPPGSYTLLGFETEYQMEWKRHKVYLIFRVENLLNRVYRDYLNRLRYFADERGRNQILILKMDI